MIASTKILFPNKATFTSSGGHKFWGHTIKFSTDINSPFVKEEWAAQGKQFSFLCSFQLRILHLFPSLAKFLVKLIVFSSPGLQKDPMFKSPYNTTQANRSLNSF